MTVTTLSNHVMFAETVGGLYFERNTTLTKRHHATNLADKSLVCSFDSLGTQSIISSPQESEVIIQSGDGVSGSHFCIFQYR